MTIYMLNKVNKKYKSLKNNIEKIQQITHSEIVDD